MRTAAVLAALLMFGGLGQIPKAVAAQDILQLLYEKCPNGGMLRSLNASYASAKSYDDASMQRSTHEIARVFYHCSLVSRELYVQDWAQFYCMQNVWFALRTPGQMRETSASIVYVADLLASYSKYGDVRKAAAGLRKLVADVDRGLPTAH